MAIVKRFLTNTFLIFASAAFTFFPACSVSEIPKNQHEAAVSEDVDYSTSGISAPADEKLFSNFDLGKLSKKADDNSETAQREIVSDLASFVLNSQYVDNPRFSNSTKLASMLTLYNRALIRLLALSLPAKEKSSLLSLYSRFVLAGCTEDLKNCDHISFFRTDPNSSELLITSLNPLDQELALFKLQMKTLEEKRHDCRLKSIACDSTSADFTQMADNYYRKIRQLYKILFVSFDLQNATKNNKLESLYLKYASDYASYLQTLPKNSDNLDLLRRHGSIFEMMTTDFVKNLNEPSYRPLFKSMIADFSPWTFSRRRKASFPFAETTMLGIAANLCSEPDMDAICSFKNAITESQSTSDYLGDNFTLRLDDLRRNHKALFSNLFRSYNPEFDLPKNDTFYIIDHLYRAHWNVDDASMIWKVTLSRHMQVKGVNPRDEEEQLLRILKNYLKIEVARMVTRTNEFMSSVYNDHSNVYSKNILDESIKQSALVSREWRQLIDRTRVLYTFIQRNLYKPDLSSRAPSYDDTEKVLLSFPKTIKYLSAFPNVMMTAYYMAVMKYDIDIASGGSTYKVGAASIITELLNDNTTLPLWFDFGNDIYHLPKMDFFYPFYYALQTETFSTFKIENKSVDEASFFENFIAKYLDDDRINLKKNVESLATKYNQNAALQDLLEICDRETLAEKSGRPASYRVQIPLDQLSKYTFLGFGQNDSPYEKLIVYDSDLITKLEEIRTFVQKKIVFVKTQIDLYDDHLKKNGTPDTLRLEIIRKVNKNLSELNDLKQSLYETVIQKHREQSTCLYRLYNIEYDHQNRLLDAEIAHLHLVYKKMSDLRAKVAEAESLDKQGRSAEANAIRVEAQKLESAYTQTENADALQRTPAPGEDFDTLNSGYYVSSKLNLLLRMRNELRKIDPNVSIETGNLEDQPLYRSAKFDRRGIAYRENEDDFIRDAMKSINGGSGAYINWINETTKVDFLYYKIKTMIEIFRAGKEKIYRVLDKNQGVDITAAEIVNEALAIDRFLSLKPKDIAMLKLFGLKRKFKTESLQKLFLDPLTQYPATLLEHAYEEFTEPDANLMEAEASYKTRFNLDQYHLLFEPSETMKNIQRAHYRPLVLASFDAATEFEKAVHERELADRGNPVTVLYEVDPNSGVEAKVIPYLDSGGVPNYLSTAKILDYQTVRAKFLEEKTLGDYNARKGAGEVDFEK